MNPPPIGQKFRITTPSGLNVQCKASMIRYVYNDVNTSPNVWYIRFEPDDGDLMPESITADGFMKMLHQRKIVAI